MSAARWPVVLFDLDGTLVDTIDLIVSSFQHAWRVGLGEELAPEVARSWIGRSLADLFADFEPEKFREMSELYVSHNVSELPRMQRTFEGVPRLLSTLTAAGIQLGIVTSKRRSTAQLSLDVAGITGIEIVAALEDTDEHKPNPRPLLFGLDKLQRQPDETVYVGDAVVDIKAARAADLGAVAVSWGAGLPDQLADENPDALVSSTDDLLAVLLGQR